MIQRFFLAFFCAWLLLQGSAIAAPVLTTTRDSFASALNDTRLGNDPAQAYFLVGLLRDMRASNEAVEALRRELLHRYVAQLDGQTAATQHAVPPPSGWQAARSRWLGGTTMPPDTVAAAIARGRLRDSVPNAQLTAAWQSAFDKSVAVRWPAAGGAQPYFMLQDRNLQSVAPGVWASELAQGQARLLLSLRLVNQSASALPVDHLEIVWGGEAATGRGGLSFRCDWDGVRPPQGSAALDAVEMLPPGGESRAMVCTSAPVGAYWKGQLSALVAKAQLPGQRPLVVSHAFDTRQRLPYLEEALANVSDQSAVWRQRLRLSQAETGRAWRSATQPLVPPVVKQWAMSPNEGWAASVRKLQWFMGATLTALALFWVGRKALRWGLPSFVVGGMTLLSIGGILTLVIARLDGGGGGTGYNSSAVMVFVVWIAVFGPMALGVWGLHALHKLLDAENLSGLQAVALGWRRALDFGSNTSRAEFWGFFVHCVWLWALARSCLVPLDRWVGAVLLVPFAALLVRRLRSLTEKQRIDMLITVICLLLIALSETF
ncbi:MAG: hypothetical protein K2Q97_10585 [Burkholderiaceae bacterium]|nr:hypothetical protein [Burkholderiaceae bacterium]